MIDFADEAQKSLAGYRERLASAQSPEDRTFFQNAVREAMPIVLVPGLNCSTALYAEQVPALWRFGPVQIADHTRDDSMVAIATRILDAAPPRFALAGLSMGGYIALEIARQAPDRVLKLALLDTGARADNPEQRARYEAWLNEPPTDLKPRVVPLRRGPQKEE